MPKKTARPFIPKLMIASKVGANTRQWWEEIGRSLTAFTEMEQAVIDWAVYFTGDRSLWKVRFMDDLKSLLPELRRSLKKAGLHRLSIETKTALTKVLSEVEALTQARNDIAHLRLRFAQVPSGNEWIPTASHVEIRKRSGDRVVIAHRDLKWLRATTANVRACGKALNKIMNDVSEQLA